MSLVLFLFVVVAITTRSTKIKVCLLVGPLFQELANDKSSEKILWCGFRERRDSPTSEWVIDVVLPQKGFVEASPEREEAPLNHCQGLEGRYLALPLSNIAPSSRKGVLRAADVGVAMLGD
jgi:hypothetical protein